MNIDGKYVGATPCRERLGDAGTTPHRRHTFWVICPRRLTSPSPPARCVPFLRRSAPSPCKEGSLPRPRRQPLRPSVSRRPHKSNNRSRRPPKHRVASAHASASRPEPPPRPSTAGAIVAGSSANSGFDNLTNTCGMTTAGCTQAQIGDVEARATLANVLWLLAAVSAAATGVTVYLDSRQAGVSMALKF